MLIYPIFISHWGCPFSCIYCNQFTITHSQDVHWEQIHFDLKRFIRHHPGEKEIALFGGSFTHLPQSVQQDLFLQLKPYLEDHTSLRISIRPDACTSDIVSWCMSHGVRTIELGVQDFSDDVLLLSQRGYTNHIVHEACSTVRNNGCKLGVQLMPGLPGWTVEIGEFNIRELLSMAPDYLRIYPTIVLKDTSLHHMYARGEYLPMTLTEAVAYTAKCLSWAEPAGIHVIKMGLSGLNPNDVVSGPYHPAFGELVRGEIMTKEIMKLVDLEGVLHIHSKDISLLLGNGKENLTRIKHRFRKSEIKIRVLDHIPRYTFFVGDTDDFAIW